MDVSIIFINYKTAEMTNDAINSVIEKSSGFSYEIIVVDNSNDAEQFEELKNIVGEKAKVIDAKGNLGFGKGNNLGVENSTGDYLLFLNTDTLLINNAIFELFNFIKNNEKVGAVGPNLYTRDMKPNHSYEKNKVDQKYEIKLNNILVLLKRKLKRDDFNFSNNAKSINGYISGASLMIRKNLFKEIGGFDKDIFMYGEDMLLCYNVKYKSNMDIYNVPSAKIIHFEGCSSDASKEISYKHAKMIVDGHTIYYNKICGIKETKKYLLKMKKILRKKIILAKLIFNKLKYNNYKNLEQAYADKLIEIENIGE